MCAWEDKFIEKIESTRDIEQRYLNKDSVYWGIMSEYYEKISTLSIVELIRNDGIMLLIIIPTVLLA